MYNEDNYLTATIGYLEMLKENLDDSEMIKEIQELISYLQKTN